jgi:diguanylate cyclase (GGDEF)-like protein
MAVQVQLVPLVSLLVGLLSLPVSAEEPSLDELLELAAELHVTAPWQESDAVLDRIEPRLMEASDEQRARYLVMRTRNKGLAGNLQTALELVPEILRLDISPERRLRAIGLGANIAMQARQHELAFDYLNQGLTLEPDVGDPIQRATLFNQASHMHIDVGELSRARNYSERAMELAALSGDTRTLCYAAYRLAYIEKTANHLGTALHNAREALQLCQASNDPVVIASVKYHLADSLRQMGRLDEADRYFQLALQGHQRSGYLTGLSQTRLDWAKLQFSRDRIEEAQRLLQNLDLDLTQLQRWELLADYHELQSNIARRNGDYVQALNHQDAHIEARERFLDHDRAMRLAYLEVAFDSQVKEQELALLREQTRVAALQEESRRQQQRLRLLGYAVATVVLVLLVLLLWHALRERRHYRQLSVIDGLTGLLNHTRFFDAAKPLIDEAHQQGKTLTLVLADIDHFKQINDRHGHLTGDEVLRQVARCFRDTLVDHGPVGRIGGEEFAVCLPNSSLGLGLRLVETLRQALAVCDLGDIDDRITMSFGIAELQPDEELEMLRLRADEALYQAKHEGRDRIVVADSQPTPREPA